MNDPHVVALIYEIEHDSSVDYSEAEPVDHEEDRFRILIKDKSTRAEMKEHHATESAALEVVEPYLRSWEMDAALRSHPDEFRLKFDRSEIVDRNPTPGVVELAATIRAGEPIVCGTLTVGKPYPKPPSGVTLNSNDREVVTLFNRFERYLNRREPLPSMAYFCLTVLEGVCNANRTEAAKRYGIGKSVLASFGKLASQKGGPDAARKAVGIEEELTQEENRFLEAAVKAIIRRVAEVAHDPHRPLKKITREELPTLPR